LLIRAWVPTTILRIILAGDKEAEEEDYREKRLESS
jgi:hypothetical protein